MNFRLAQPVVLVDLNGVNELTYLEATPDGLRMGAMTRQRAVERSAVVGRCVPLLHEVMPFVAHAQIRNRGTVGGSLAHADPAAELPAVMVALNARFHLRSADGGRSVGAQDFFTGLFATVLEPGELLVEIEVPAKGPRTGHAFREISRRHGDYALVGVSASLTLDETGSVDAARIALLSVGDGPVAASGAARSLIGERPSAEVIAAAAEVAATTDIDPPTDIHASASYRRQLVRVLTRRALLAAAERASVAGA